MTPPDDSGALDLNKLDDDVRRDVLKVLEELRRPDPPVIVTMRWSDGSPRRVACAVCEFPLTAHEASHGCPRGCVASPPCCDCGTTTAARSACPLCAKVYCQPCAEKPYETCCDNGVPL